MSAPLDQHIQERDALLRCLRDQRAHVLATLEGLHEADLRRSALPSGWTPLGLIRHLTYDVERFWFRIVINGEHLELPSDAATWNAPDDVPVHAVLAAYQQEAHLADDVITAHDLHTPGARWPLHTYPGTPDRNLSATVLHVIAETAGHAGHLDITRELIDGHQHLVMTSTPTTTAARPAIPAGTTAATPANAPATTESESHL